MLKTDSTVRIGFRDIRVSSAEDTLLNPNRNVSLELAMRTRSFAFGRTLRRAHGACLIGHIQKPHTVQSYGLLAADSGHGVGMLE